MVLRLTYVKESKTAQVEQHQTLYELLGRNQTDLRFTVATITATKQSLNNRPKPLNLLSIQWQEAEVLVKKL